jgi:putative ABC transport system substrate-binding protein
MMDRRRFLLMSLAGALAVPRATEAQTAERVYRLGFLGQTSAADLGRQTAALRQGLRALGYEEGRNLVIEYRWAERKLDRLPTLATELVGLKVDIIVTHGSAGSRAAKQATGTIPIVIAVVGDPVASGVVSSLSRPGGNITGLVLEEFQSTVKWLELLKQVTPSASDVGWLDVPGIERPEVAEVWRQRENDAARSLELTIRRMPVRGPNDLAQAFTNLKQQGVQAVTPSSADRHLWEACRQGLRDLGYVEGRNIILEPRWADGHHERLPRLAADLVRLKVDLIVSAATPGSQAAKAATTSIPIVFVAVAEPMRAGLVASLARPGSNVTGISLLTPELSGKRLQLLAEVLPGVRRVAVLTNPDNFSHVVFLEQTRAAAQTLGIQLQPVEARRLDEIEQARHAAADGRSTALIVFDDPVFWSHRKRIVEVAAERRLAAIYGYGDFVDEGGLMSYGPDRIALYRRTATYVDKILKGARPADLPVEQPTKFELVINLKTAKALGLTIPPSLLARADQVIE